MGDEDDQRHHVVLFPFMAQGHITPFLLLSDLIQQKLPNSLITLVNTPLNIQSIKSSSHPLNPNLILKSLPFPAAAFGLPPNGENTANIPVHLIVKLWEASESLQPAFEQLIADIARQDGAPPSLIVADNFLAWTADVARKFGAYHATFFTSGASATAVIQSLWKHLPHNSTASDDIALPDFPDVRIHRSRLNRFLSVADGTDPWSAFNRRQIDHISKSDGVLANTVEELEARGLLMLQKQLNVPVWPIGPLLRLATSSKGASLPLMRWLDAKPEASVLYVSFGSQNTIFASEMMELARGIEASGRPFLWVIRPPIGYDITGEFRDEWLPEGFEERMSAEKRGVVVRGWAPQVEILSHRAVGAFLSHCGWNSVLESLYHGVPIIGWPLSADQICNSKFLEEEAGVCAEVAVKTSAVAKVKGEEIKTVIETVIGGEEKGKEMRRKAGEVGEMLRGAWKDLGDGDVGSSLRGFSQFMEAVSNKIL